MSPATAQNLGLHSTERRPAPAQLSLSEEVSRVSVSPALAVCSGLWARLHFPPAKLRFQVFLTGSLPCALPASHSPGQAAASLKSIVSGSPFPPGRHVCCTKTHSNAAFWSLFGSRGPGPPWVLSTFSRSWLGPGPVEPSGLSCPGSWSPASWCPGGGFVRWQGRA